MQLTNSKRQQQQQQQQQQQRQQQHYLQISTTKSTDRQLMWTATGRNSFTLLSTVWQPLCRFS
jgi:hypothetical protein